MLGGRLPRVALASSGCPGCGIVLGEESLAANAYVCECGRHFPLHGEAWIRLIADEGSWQEHWSELRPADLLRWKRPRAYSITLDAAEAEGLNEAVRVGTCTLGGQPLWLAVFDFRFVGGTLSVVAGERLVRAMEAASRSDGPIVVVTASGGARMQEGVYALMQMAKVNAAVADLVDTRTPYFSILTNPTYGGTAASMALIADVNIAEPGAAIGFTGPRVIQQATHESLPGDFQSAEFQLGHGQIDMIVPRTELRARLAWLAEMFR